MHVKNASTGAVDVPLTGTTFGDLYGGQRSGWKTIAPGAEEILAPDEPANSAAPTISGTPRGGEQLTARLGTWTGSPTIDYGYQWQRCDGKGEGCQNITGATASAYTLGAGDVGARMRVIVSAGNWIASVSQAPSAVTDAVVKPPDPPPAQRGTSGQGGSGKGGKSPAGGTSGKLALTNIKMSPKRFAVAHSQRQRGTKLDGTRITWRLNKAATVRLVIQRRIGSGSHRRWVAVGTIQRSARRGTGVVRFTGRFKSKPIAPSVYRLTITATAGKEQAGPRRIQFQVVRG
jgi:hypothetical protein